MRFLEVCETDISSDIIIENNIIDTENYLKSVAEEYNIDYRTNDIRPLEYLYEDSIFSKIKNFIKMIFQKAIQFLIKIWKFITGLIKKAWNFFINLIKRIMGNKHDKEREIDIKTGFIMVESSSIQEKSFKSKEEIRDEYKKSLEKLTTKIRKLSQENISFMKRMESGINNKIVNESTNIIEEKVIYNDKKYEFNDKEFDNANSEIVSLLKKDAEIDGVVQGKSYIEHMGKYDLKILSTKKLEAVKKAKSLTEGFDMLISGHLEEIASEFMKDPDKWNERAASQSGFTIPNALINTIVAFQGRGVSEADMINFIKSKFYPTFKGSKTEVEEQIKRWVNLKINYNRALVNCLTEMVKNNTEIFNISMQMANLIATDMSNEDFKSIKKVIMLNNNKFLTLGGACYDLRKVGLGCVIMSEDSLWDWSNNYGKWARSLFDGDGPSDLALQYLTKYDVTVLSHGAVDNNRWIMDPVKTPNGSGPYEEMEPYVRKLISEGFKRINIVTCNPGGVKLSDNIIKNKKVLIQMSTKSTLIS